MSNIWITIGAIGPTQFGKSTLLGYLIYNQIKNGDREVTNKQIASILEWEKEYKRSDRFFSLILDYLKHEREKVYNIRDTEKHFFKSIIPKHYGIEGIKYNIMLQDNPGHKDFLRILLSMYYEIDVSLLFVSAANEDDEKIFPKKIFPKLTEYRSNYYPGSFFQHALSSYYQGVRKTIIIISKMDCCKYDEYKYNKIKQVITDEFKKNKLEFNKEFNNKLEFIPVSINVKEKTDENVVNKSNKMNWYKGPTVNEIIFDLPINFKTKIKPFRMSVDVKSKDVEGYSLIVGGKVISGTININETIIFKPSNVQAKIRSIKMRDEKKVLDRVGRWPSKTSAIQGEHISLGLGGSDLSKIKIRDIIGPTSFPPSVHSKFIANITLMDLERPSKYRISTYSTQLYRIGPIMIEGRISKIIEKYTSNSDLKISDHLEKGDSAKVEITLNSPVPIDTSDNYPELSSFIFLESNLLVGIGAIEKII